MRRTLWFFVFALLAVDIAMLVQRRDLTDRFRDLLTEYADEEETLLIGTGVVPATFPRLQAEEPTDDTVQFFLLVSVDDCTNCIEDEVTRLNQMVLQGSTRIRAVQGFFVDEERSEIVEALVKHLSPRPVFPVSVTDALAHLPQATTPLVLVIRSRDGRILDAHKPIPEDLRKRDAFYARWTAALGLS